jgi:hypothetical protein
MVTFESDLCRHRYRYTASMIGLEEKIQEKDPKAPEFIMPLEDLFVDEGENAKFIAKVDGHPRPRVTWSINNIDIANVIANSVEEICFVLFSCCHMLLLFLGKSI